MRGQTQQESELKLFEKPSWILSPDGDYKVYKKTASVRRDCQSDLILNGKRREDGSEVSGPPQKLKENIEGKSFDCEELTRPASTDMHVGSSSQSKPSSRPVSINRRLVPGQPTPLGISLSGADDTVYNIEKRRQLERANVSIPSRNNISHVSDSLFPSRHTSHRDEKWKPISKEEKMRNFIAESLRECSRQRLRAVHWSMCQYGNVEARITVKDLQQAFQDNHVDLPQRVFQHLVESYDDVHGIDYVSLYRYLLDAHALSGRDSVLAMYSNGDAEEGGGSVSKQSDRNDGYVQRIQGLLIGENTLMDLDGLKEALEERDKNKSGCIARQEVLDLCNEYQLPLYGALLRNLINYCDDIKIGLICWSEFLEFLQKAQNMALSVNPGLQCAPRKVPNKEAVEPEPIDELSWGARSKISKLLKKASQPKSDGQKEKTQTEQSKMHDSHKESSKEKSETQDSKLKKNAESKYDNITVGIVGIVGGTDTSEITILFFAKLPNELFKGSEMTISFRTWFRATIAEILIWTPHDRNITRKPPEQHSHDMEAPTGVRFPTYSQQNIYLHIKINMQNKQVHFKNMPVEINGVNTNDNLELHWIYGYRGNDCRRNIHILHSGELIYFMSSIAIIYNRDKHSQRHYTEHTQSIKCIDLHSDGVTVATGQYSEKTDTTNTAHVRIWNADKLQTLHVLGLEQFQKVVTCISFAHKKDILAAVDNSTEKHLTIWDTASGCLLAERNLNAEVVCDVVFSVKYQDVVTSIGKEHLASWRFKNNTIQDMAPPDYNNFEKARFVTCILHTTKGDLVTGDSNGTIYVWGKSESKITQYIKNSHDGPVFSLLYVKNHLLSGGRDGYVRMWNWNKNMDRTGSIQIPRSEGGVRMLQVQKDALFIGTTVNSILLANFVSLEKGFDDSALVTPPLTQGHFDDVQCLCVVDNSNSNFNLVTAGVDGLVCFYNADDTASTQKLMVKEKDITCLDYTNAANAVALGTKNGCVVILECTHMEELLLHNIGQDGIHSLKFSPGGTTLAARVGTSIYIFQKSVKEERLVWSSCGMCQGYDDEATDMEWSNELYEGEFILKITTSKRSHTLEGFDNGNDFK
ncbi:hypothetical protein ScPMuIL_002934 [Solemya velum]